MSRRIARGDWHRLWRAAGEPLIDGLLVACPVCNVGPGQHCRSRSGHVREQHARRIDLHLLELQPARQEPLFESAQAA